MADTRERDTQRKEAVPGHSSQPADAIGSPTEREDGQSPEPSATGRDERLIGAERYPRKGDDPITDKI